MEEKLSQFVMSKSFPCIMAKAVFRKGFVSTMTMEDLESQESVTSFLSQIYSFVGKYRSQPKKLSSFILFVDHEKFGDFGTFQQSFWKFLRKVREADEKRFTHDERVASDPDAANFSFSIGNEAFFILALHPDSPRMARRFASPAIVFNPHQQFENLRLNGLFAKIRDVIRNKDKLLQGFINPMLKDFGEKSEVYQYLGVQYDNGALNPLLKG